jgi:branched-chain amino acid transport system substrate-binding protein
MTVHGGSIVTRRSLMALLLPPCLLGQEPYIPSKGRQPFVGPGYDDPEPATFTDVPIGWFGPDDPHHPLGGTLWAGASLALDDLNREGGYKGKPFRIVSRWSDNPWRAGASAVVQLIYQDKVWALIGGIDGATTHLAEQVVAKAWCTLIDPVSTDSGVNYANVPWTFSLSPNDADIAAALVENLQRSGKLAATAILVSTEHDSRTLADEFVKALNKAGATPLRRQEFTSGIPEADSIAAEISGPGAANIAIFAGLPDIARLANVIRAKAPGAVLLAGTAVNHGPEPAGVRVPALCTPAPRAAALSARATSKFGYPADCRMLFAYDSVSLLAAALRRAGLNRSRIREQVATMKYWGGLSGEIVWDSYGRNRRRVTVAASVNANGVSLKNSSLGVLRGGPSSSAARQEVYS